MIAKRNLEANPFWGFEFDAIDAMRSEACGDPLCTGNAFRPVTVPLSDRAGNHQGVPVPTGCGMPGWSSTRRRPLSKGLKKMTALLLDYADSTTNASTIAAHNNHVIDGRSSLIFHMEGRTVLRARLAPVIEASLGNISMAEPFLHLGNVRLVGKYICRCRRTHGGCANADRFRRNARQLGIFQTTLQ